MTNKEQMNTLFELYKEGLISKSDLANGIKSINEPEQKDTLVIDEDILNNDLYKTDEARNLAQESRNNSKALRERQAQRDADRLENEARIKREEELKSIHKELSDDRKIIIDILSSFKNRVTGEEIYSISNLQHMPTKDLLKLYNDMEVNAPSALKQIIDSKGYTEWAERRVAKDPDEEVENIVDNDSLVTNASSHVVNEQNDNNQQDNSVDALTSTGLSKFEGKDESNVDDKFVVPFEIIGDDEDEKGIKVEPVSIAEANGKNDSDHTLVMGKDLVDIGESTNEADQVKIDDVEKPDNNADLTPERPRLVTMIAGAKSKFQELINNKANVAVAACIAIGGAAAVIATGPVGFTALGAIAQATGSAALIGGGSVVSAAAANNYTKGR